jgi:CheY-like chemotaxis protein
VLVVEDHEPALVAVSDYLINKGFKVAVARNGAEAVDACRESLPELVLMDVQMPLMDGLEATQKIRELPGGRGVKVVAFTALAMQDDQTRCLAAGADAYLSKPFRFSELLELIKRLLSTPG